MDEKARLEKYDKINEAIKRTTETANFYETKFLSNVIRGEISDGDLDRLDMFDRVKSRLFKLQSKYKPIKFDD